MTADHQTVSRSMTRYDSLEKALGKAKFGGDVHLHGMLHARLMHSPLSHAKILCIDISRAARLPGVRAVITGEDAGTGRVGRFVRDRTIMARGKVRHIGEVVAAVAAVDRDTAEEALQLIKVDYEELPGVFDPIEAMEAGSPIIHEELGSYFSLTKLNHKGNILDECFLREGNLEEAWARADVIHEETYNTQAVHQGFIQPHEAVAQVDAAGKVTVWSSTKALFGVRGSVCQALHLPMSDVRVLSCHVGGDFGGKGNAYIEPIVVLLARKSNLPVSLSLSRQEEFTATFPRERCLLKLKLAARKDGTLQGYQCRYILDAGAYCDTLQGHHFTLEVGIGPYRIPHYDVTRYYVYTNNHPTGHFRGPMGMIQSVFAMESHMDAMAVKLGMDPIEFRRKNKLSDGDVVPGGATLRNTSVGDVLDAADGFLKAEKKEKQKSRGWGVACSQYQTQRFRDIPFISSACVRANEDGTVVVMTGTIESGGGQLTTLAQIAAEVLKVPYEAVRVVGADSDVAPRDYSTSASQTTYRAGMMVKMAAEDLRGQLLELGSARLRAPAGALELAGGAVFVKDKPSQTVPVVQLIREQGSLQGTGAAARARKVAILEEEKDIIDGPSSAVHAAEVEVDTNTGNVKVLNYYAVHDVGFAINPENVAAQIHGAVGQGLGYALSEELATRGGKVTTPTFMDYKIPGAKDMPPVVPAWVEVPSGHGPYGAKGYSESGLLLSAPAVANAVFNATGVRITSLPITSEKVLKALQEKEGKGR